MPFLVALLIALLVFAPFAVAAYYENVISQLTEATSFEPRKPGWSR